MVPLALQCLLQAPPVQLEAAVVLLPTWARVPLTEAPLEKSGSSPLCWPWDVESKVL